MRSSSLKIGTCFVYVLAPLESDFGGGIGGGEGCAGCGGGILGVGCVGDACIHTYIHVYVCTCCTCVRGRVGA